MLYLQAVIIDGSIGIIEAQKLAQQFIKDKRKTFFSIDENNLVFKNIAKSNFDSKTFQTREIGNVKLLYGYLKKPHLQE